MAQLRQQLIDATITVLLNEGPASVTTRRIATVAGCSEGSIYNHFTTKEALVAAAVGERFRFPHRVSELAASAGEGEVLERLREVASLALDFYEQGSPMLAYASGRREVMRAHAREVHERGGGPWRTLDNLAAWLGAEQKLGRVHPDADPHAAASALLGSCLWHTIVAHAWGPDLAPDRMTVRERAVSAVWRGLAP